MTLWYVILQSTELSPLGKVNSKHDCLDLVIERPIFASANNSPQSYACDSQILLTLNNNCNILALKEWPLLTSGGKVKKIDG